MNKSTYILVAIIFILTVITTVSLTINFTSNKTEIKTSDSSVSSPSMSASKITKESDAPNTVSEKEIEDNIKESLAKTVVDNIKKNSLSEIDKVSKIEPKPKESTPSNDTRTASEMIDDVSTNVAATGYSGLFSLLFALQKISVPAAATVTLLATIFALVYHKNKRILKFCIFIAVFSPIFFVLVHLLPALYLYSHTK